MDNKKYAIPEDLHDIYLEYANYLNLKSEFVHSKMFGFKRAVKAGRLALQKQLEFWEGIFELYPNLKGKKCVYDWEERTVRLKEEADNAEK